MTRKSILNYTEKGFTILFVLAEKIIGCILMFPAIRGILILSKKIPVPIGTTSIFSDDPRNELPFVVSMSMLDPNFKMIGTFTQYFPPALMIYFGLMAVAGAYLLKGGFTNIKQITK